MKVGFIGLGQMGTAMATNLLKAGHEVTVFNRTPGRSHTLEGLGARVATAISEVCQGEVVITMLANDAAVSDVTLSNNGVIASLAKRGVHISMSTISVALSKRLAQAHTLAGQRYIAAPVFGRPDMAAAAKLFIVAAGDSATVDACVPLFDALSQKTSRVGSDPAAANLVKLSGNFLTAAIIEALGEAIALVGKAGIDRQTYVDLLTSTLFTAPAYKLYGTLIAAGTFAPPAFAAPLGHKDILLALDAADHLQVPMPLARLLHQRFVRLLAQGGAQLDWSAIGGLATQDAGEGPRPSTLSVRSA
jgi:3-hydroxyisobutyrate dehydrogenase-like beta-hydroxyacid dehydrogenase